MMNNGLGGGFGNMNIKGINRMPSNIGGINKAPSNINGINGMPKKDNPFANVSYDKQRSNHIMNSDGTNAIRNKMNSGGNYNGS